MKTISLWEPWATLVAIKAKRIETRGWFTNYIGPIAVHSAKRWTRAQERLCFTPPFFEVLSKAGYLDSTRKRATFPRGTVRCTCLLMGTFEIEKTTVYPDGWITDFRIPPPEPELSFGNYAVGRHAWILGDVRSLEKRIPWMGRQGFFNVPDELFEPAALAGLEMPQ